MMTNRYCMHAPYSTHQIKFKKIVMSLWTAPHLFRFHTLSSPLHLSISINCAYSGSYNDFGIPFSLLIHSASEAYFYGGYIHVLVHN